jgi:GNAT superfamily N-acetyltransferase
MYEGAMRQPSTTEAAIGQDILEMYAQSFKARHTLKNGLEITIRPILHEDKKKLLEAFLQLDQSSIYTRFFGFKKSLSDAELEQATNVDCKTTVALVATISHGESEVIIASCRYVRATPLARSAEVAFTVEENYHGLGIAGLLFEHLVNIARKQGLSHFDAEVLTANLPMLTVFRRCGLPVNQRIEGDTVHVSIALDSKGS